MRNLYLALFSLFLLTHHACICVTVEEDTGLYTVLVDNRTQEGVSVTARLISNSMAIDSIYVEAGSSTVLCSYVLEGWNGAQCDRSTTNDIEVKFDSGLGYRCDAFFRPSSPNENTCFNGYEEFLLGPQEGGTEASIILFQEDADMALDIF